MQDEEKEVTKKKRGRKKDEGPKRFKVYKKTYVIELVSEMLGTTPKDESIFKSFIDSKRPEHLPEPQAMAVEQMGSLEFLQPDDDELKDVEKLEEKGWTGFRQDEEGIYLINYMIMGFLKNAANVLKENLGVKALKSKINNYAFVFPRKVHFGLEKPDGMQERPVRAMTPQGPRVFLTRADFVSEGRELTFSIHWIEHKEITEEIIDELMAYGQYQGLGQFRNGWFGSFVVKSASEVELVRS